MECEIIQIFDKKPKIMYSIKPEICEYPDKRKEYYSGTNPDWESLLKKYEGFIKIKDWKELILCLTNKSDYLSTGSVNLHGAAIDSYSVQAARAGFFKRYPFFNIAMAGILITSDNRILAGQRAGKVSPGNYAPIPAGSVRFHHKYDIDPLTHTFFTEAKEEIGTGFEYSDPELLGILFSHDEPQGLKFLMKSHVNAPFKDILAARGTTDGNAKGAEGNRKKKMAKPIDKWEHKRIDGIQVSEEGINTFIKKHKVAGNLHPILEAELKVVIEYLKRKSN